MSNPVPSFIVDVWPLGASISDMRKWGLLYRKMKVGERLIYIQNVDCLSLKTITLNNCGFVIDPDLLRYVNEGFEFTASLWKYSEYKEGPLFSAIVKVLFVPLSAEKDKREIDSRQEVGENV